MQYTKTKFIAAMLFFALTLSNPAIHAQTKADYQALKTRVQELEAVVQKLENAQTKPEPNSSAAKIKLTDSITELKLYGDQGSRNPDGGIWENQTGANDPPHSYTGTCRKPCALTLRHKTSYVDLTGNSSFAITCTGYGTSPIGSNLAALVE